MKNSVCWPLAVCSITHGAILRWNGRRSDSRAFRPVAREDLIVPTAAIPAAIKNTTQRTRLNRDLLDVRSRFLIVAKATAFLSRSGYGCQYFSTSRFTGKRMTFIDH
jgi:hypothetical protein